MAILTTFTLCSLYSNNSSSPVIQNNLPHI